MNTDRWAKREEPKELSPAQVAARAEHEKRKMLTDGYVDTPVGRYYLRCCRKLTDAEIKDWLARREKPPKTVSSVCLRKLNHGGKCSPGWEFG